MADDTFFDESTEQSQAKSRIVAKYFWAWARRVKRAAKRQGGRIGYLDMFSGPGRYRDGRKSTPLMILESAIADPDIREMLLAHFNDAQRHHAESLEAEIRAIPGIDSLKFFPRVTAEEVSEELVKIFESVKFVPTFSFIDPWGYKGLSLRLIRSVIKDWGCDCVFFFNYNRVNPGLSNEIVVEHMNALFGAERANSIRIKVQRMAPPDREAEILEQLALAIKENGAKYVLPFTFKGHNEKRTSHHLVFASKHFAGYEMMKDIMAAESSEAVQGVPSFEYLPANARQPLLFELQRPLDDLEDMLLTEFAGRTLSRQDIYVTHSVGRRYVESNYRQVLLKLEEVGKISADPPVSRRPKRLGEPTFADSVKVTFPRI